MLLLDRQPAVDATPAAEARPARPWLWTLLILGAALALTLGLRLLYLGFPLGVDEGGVAMIAKAWGTGGHGSLYGAYWLDRPPFLVALYKLAITAGPTGIRVLGAVAAVALVTVTTAVAWLVSGHRAARIAAVAGAVLASSVALAAVYTPAELLASVPAAASVGCLVAAHRTRAARWLFGAGLLAVGAALIKQSFLDAGFAGAVFLLASCIADRRLHLRYLAAYAAGALVPLAVVGVWLAVARVAPGSLVYALFGFRMHALHVLAGSGVPLGTRLQRLTVPVEQSGLDAVLVVALAGFVALRRQGVIAVTLLAWLLAGAVGVLGGGTYWPHYLIQLVAPAAVLAGTALAAVPALPAIAAVAVLAWFSASGTVTGVGAQRAVINARGVQPVARYVREHAKPGDTQYVMYARANVGYYTGLPSPYPYAWSLIVRAHPDASARLLHLLRSSRRPTWIVGWQKPSSWHLDPNGDIARALRLHYRLTGRVHGHPIYHRRSSAP